MTRGKRATNFPGHPSLRLWYRLVVDPDGMARQIGFLHAEFHGLSDGFLRTFASTGPAEVSLIGYDESSVGAGIKKVEECRLAALAKAYGVGHIDFIFVG